MAAEPPARPVVFISYAWTDFDLLVAEKLYAYLKVLPYDIEIFLDRKMLVPGDRLETKILDALRRAIVAVTILSVEYFDPERYTARVELPAIIQAEAALHLRVIPVVSTPLPLDQFEFFQDRLAANDVNEPLSLFGVGHHRFDQILLKVFRTVRNVITETVDSQRLSPARHDLDQLPASPPPILARYDKAGQVHGAPPLPSRYFDRREAQDVRQDLFDNRILGIAGKYDASGLFGEGGIGKSVIASALVWDDEVRRRFPDGIFWLTVGEGTHAFTVQAELCRKLNVSIDFQNSLDGRKVLRSMLVDRRILVVLDDVWSAAQLEDLVVTGQRSRTLVTTRSDQRVLRPFNIRSFPVLRLDTDEAVSFLRGFVGDKVTVSGAKLAEIAKQVLGVPLALALLGAAIRSGQDPDRIVARLESDEFGEHPYASQFKAHRIAAGALSTDDETVLQRYHSLAVFPSDTVVPIHVIEQLWQYLYPSSPQLDASAELARSDELGLLKIIRDDGVTHIALHDLNHAFVRLEVDSTLMSLHGTLLESYRTRLGTGNHWWSLDQQETYLWNNLAYHLNGAGEPIASVVLDPRFIVKKLAYVGYSGLSTDFKLSLEQDGSRVQLLTTALSCARSVEYLLKGMDSVESCAATFALYWSLKGRAMLGDITGQLFVPARPMALGSSQLVRTLLAHAEPVLAVDWSADGRLVATGSSDHTIKVWLHETGELLEHIQEHRRPVHGLRWAPSGYLLASVSGDLVNVDDSLCIWDLGDGARLICRAEHPTRVTAVAWSPSGQLIATGCEDSAIRLWTIGAVLQFTLSSDGRRGPVRNVSWSPDGKTLATVFDNGSSTVLDLTELEEIELTSGRHLEVRCVDWSPDASSVVLGGPQRLVVLREAVLEGAGSLTRLNGARTSINSVAWSRHGIIAGAGGNLLDANGSIWLWDALSRVPAGRFIGHTDRVNDISWAPNGLDLVSGSHDGTARIWSARELRVGDDQPGTGWTEPVAALRVSPDGGLTAAAFGDFTSSHHYIEVRRSEGLASVLRIDSPHTGVIASMRWAADGASLVTGGVDGSVYLTEVGDSSETVPRLLAVGGSVRALERSRDGQWILVSRSDRFGCDDGLIEVLSVNDRTQVEAHPVVTGAVVRSLELNGRGDLLALGYGDLSGRSSRVEILRYPEFRVVSTYNLWRARITGLSWSGAGNRLAVVCAGGTLTVIDTERNSIDFSVRAHDDAAIGVTWCDDVLVTAGNDRRVRIWSSPLRTGGAVTLGLVETPVAVQQMSGSRSFVLATREMINILGRA